MSYFSLFIISFTIGLSGALAPGPLLATVVYESARRGAKSVPLIVLGHGLLEIVMVGVIALGISRFINNPFLLKVISFLGVVILLYFGLKMFLSTFKLSLEGKSFQEKSSNLLLTGITMSLANPYWTIWWLTIGLGLILSAQKLGLLGISIFFMGHILADLGWYSFISFSINKGRKFISLKIYQGTIAICALTLIGFAFWFAINTLKLKF